MVLLDLPSGNNLRVELESSRDKYEEILEKLLAILFIFKLLVCWTLADLRLIKSQDPKEIADLAARAATVALQLQLQSFFANI